jgi:hypothetical protein
MTHYGKNRTEGSGSDEDWFERFRSDDSRSMTVVFDIYITKLVHYAEKLIEDTCKAEEIASGALQKAWVNRKSYESMYLVDTQT